MVHSGDLYLLGGLSSETLACPESSQPGKRNRRDLRSTTEEPSRDHGLRRSPLGRRAGPVSLKCRVDNSHPHEVKGAIDQARLP